MAWVLYRKIRAHDIVWPKDEIVGFIFCLLHSTVVAASPHHHHTPWSCPWSSRVTKTTSNTAHKSWRRRYPLLYWTSPFFQPSPPPPPPTPFPSFPLHSPQTSLQAHPSESLTRPPPPNPSPSPLNRAWACSAPRSTPLSSSPLTSPSPQPPPLFSLSNSNPNSATSLSTKPFSPIPHHPLLLSLPHLKLCPMNLPRVGRIWNWNHAVTETNHTLTFWKTLRTMQNTLSLLPLGLWLRRWCLLRKVSSWTSAGGWIFPGILVQKCRA